MNLDYNDVEKERLEIFIDYAGGLDYYIKYYGVATRLYKKFKSEFDAISMYPKRKTLVYALEAKVDTYLSNRTVDRKYTSQEIDQAGYIFEE